jgi:dTDP-4-amino-4,6-dideoxygalactose transaminase
MITTQREELDRLAQALRDHGASRSDLARHEGKATFLLAEYNHLGYNYRMTDIQGALGCTQMDRVEWILARRTHSAQIYNEILSEVDWLETPLVSEGFVHGYQAYVCLFRPEEPGLENVEQLHQQRNALMMRLEEKGIATRQGTHAPVILGYYTGKYKLRPEQFPNAYLADRLSLTLPLYVQMTEVEQALAVDELQQVFEEV